MDVDLSKPRQLTPAELPLESTSLCAYLARFPVERNHPRATSAPAAPLWKSDEVLVAHTYNTVFEVFERLIKEGFQGCPVIDNNDNFIGMVDMLALVDHCLTSFEAWKLSDKNIANLKDEASIWTKYSQITEFRNARISSLAEKPNWKSKNPFVPVYRGFSLLYVLELMARLGAHRIPVLCGEDRKVTGILTQSMIISLIDQDLNNSGFFGNFGFLRNVPASEIVNGSDTLYVANVNDFAVNAFKKMVQCNISGLPIVDEKGELVDAIAARDLRGISPNAGNFDILFNSVEVFKEKCRNLFPTQTPRKPVYVLPTDDFQKVITRMRDGNIHRVFVCRLNSDNRPVPISVITQRDILRFIIYRLGMVPAPTVIPATQQYNK